MRSTAFPVRRASNRDVSLKRAALNAVRPVSAHIGAWQTVAIKLRTRYQFEVDPAQKSLVAAQAHHLLVEVAESSAQLALDAASLPAAVTHNGRFQDVVRALATLTSSLETFAAPEVGTIALPRGR